MVEKSKRAQEPEIGVSEHSEKERLVAAHQADLLPKIAEEVDPISLLRRGGRHAIDAQACEEADDGESQQKVARIDLASVEMLGQRSAGHRTNNNREEGSQFDDAVTPGQALCGQQLRQQTVLRWPKESSLSCN